MQKEQFGILLTTLRKKNGISQKEMADRLSVSVSAVSKWEHGKNLPDMTILGKIAEILQVSCDELMNPEKTLEKLTNSEAPVEDAEEKHSRILKIAVLAGIAVLVIGMVLLYRTVWGKADFEQVGARYIDDPYWGKVYDIAAVMHGRTDEDLLITYMEEVKAQAEEDPELETNIVRITYFKKKSDALKWENPESYSYIFLNADGQAYPSYFEPVYQELTLGWTDYREGHPTSGLMDAFCDRGLSNGGREENGLFISYIDYETDAEPQYVFFHLVDLLTDAEADEWDWASAGAFCDEEQGKTYFCYYDFNDLTNAGERDPQLILVEFDTADPGDYQATPYAVEPRNIFSWYCEGYRIGDDLYIAGQEELGAIDLNTKEFRYCREEKAWAEEYAQKVFGEETYYLRAFRGILEQDDVTVYSAEVAEAIDMPAVGMVFVAVRGNQPIAYMSVDLTVEDIAQGVKTKAAE